MKFIRKNGRIIPIGEKKSSAGGYGKTAAYGALVGALNMGVGIVAKRPMQPKFIPLGVGVAATGAALGLAGQAYSIHRGVKEYKKTGSKIEGVKEFLGHSVSLGLGTFAGAGALIGGLKAKPKITQAAQRFSTLYKRRHLKIIK